MPGSNPFRRSRIGADSFAHSPSLSLSQPAPAPASDESRGPGTGYTNSDNNNNAVHHDFRPFPRPHKTKSVRIASPPVPVSSPVPSDGNPASSEPEDQYTTFRGRPIAHRGSPPPEARDGEGGGEEGGNEDPFEGEGEGSEGGESPEGDVDFDVDVDADREVEWSAHGQATTSRTTTKIEGMRGLGSTLVNSSNPPLHRRSYSSNHAAITAPGQPPQPDSSSRPKRATLDVDAFKRLLMTGDAYAGTDEGSNSGLGLSVWSAGDVQGGIRSYENDGPTSPSQERRKPPPPKTRHGRLIRGVYESTSMPPAQASVPSMSTSPPSMPPERRLKPLPRTPSEASMTPSTDSSNPQAQFRRPPTPPLTRRHSQMKQDKSGISRSNSARLSMNSNTPNTNNLSRRTSMPKTPPPPPSPRREPAATTTSASSIYRSPPLNNTLPKPPEPLSPNDTSPDTLSIHRSASGPIKGLSRQSSTSTSNVPPRPPPPRRSGGGGGSNRASLDDARPVIIPSQSQAQTQHPPSQASDILADLSRLQEEVDNLRGAGPRR